MGQHAGMELTRHSIRRNLVTASSGAIVITSGVAVGIVAADLRASWSQDELSRLATEVPPDPAVALAASRPVIVTVVKETHVTPDPVVVRKKVYRTRVAAGSPRTARVRSGSRTTRTVVAPPRRAAAPARKPARPRATSKTS